MALPPENRTPRMELLQAIVARTPREKLMDFPVLKPAEHQLIGAFIQKFNYMDFNLRRAIETLPARSSCPKRRPRNTRKFTARRSRQSFRTPSRRWTRLWRTSPIRLKSFGSSSGGAKFGTFLAIGRHAEFPGKTPSCCYRRTRMTQHELAAATWRWGAARIVETPG